VPALAPYKIRFPTTLSVNHTYKSLVLYRKEATVIYRLRTGHCGLRAHLKRLVVDTPLCQCGNADQTPEHILQDCPNFAGIRKNIRPGGAEMETKPRAESQVKLIDQSSPGSSSSLFIDAQLTCSTSSPDKCF
jgi:hypothetical protein